MATDNKPAGWAVRAFDNVLGVIDRTKGASIIQDAAPVRELCEALVRIKAQLGTARDVLQTPEHSRERACDIDGVITDCLEAQVQAEAALAKAREE